MEIKTRYEDSICNQLAFQNFRPCGASAYHNLFYCHTPASQSTWSPISIVIESECAKHNGFPMDTGLQIVWQPWQRWNPHNSTFSHEHGQCVTVNGAWLAKSCLSRRIQAVWNNHKRVEVCGIRRFLGRYMYVASDNRKWNKSRVVQQFVIFQEINDACDNHKWLKFHNGHRSLVTIVGGTGIVESSALPVDTGKGEESGKFKVFPTILTAHLNNKW